MAAFSLPHRRPGSVQFTTLGVKWLTHSVSRPRRVPSCLHWEAGTRAVPHTWGRHSGRLDRPCLLFYPPQHVVKVTSVQNVFVVDATCSALNLL